MRPTSGGSAVGDDDGSAEDDDAPGHPLPVPMVSPMKADAVAVPAVPRRILDWSQWLARSEEDLKRALIVTLLGGPGNDEQEIVRATIALRFEIKEAWLTLFPWGLAIFLLILPNEEIADTIFNEGRPIKSSSARLHVMRWMRFSKPQWRASQ